MAEIETHTTRWESLEQWSGTAFLFSGMLLLLFTVLAGLRGFTGFSPAPPLGVATGGLGLLGLIVGFIGLYPRIRDSAPRLSIVGVGAVMLSAVGVLGALGWAVVSVASGALSAQPPIWVAAALPLALLLNTIGFFLFSVVSLRTEVFSQTVGLLLLVPPVMWISLIVAGTTTDLAAPDFYTYVVISASLLGLGYLLRTESEPTDRAEPTPTEVRHD